MQKVTIIGVGLIGGSLGLALKRALPEQVEITGHDRDRRAVSDALKLKAIDKGEGDLGKSVKGAELIIIATPILQIREVMRALGPLLPTQCVVTDTGSTKAQVMSWAQELLPSQVDFIGGHPMAGKEVAGVQSAEATLFEGATYCICPSPRASQKAIDLVEGLAGKIGAVPYFPDPVEHDGLVAAVSHLPLVLSTALVSVTTTAESWREMSRLASSGFKTSTRLASTDPAMSTGICTTNREALGHWIDRFIQELERYKELIQGDETKLQEALAQVREARERWVSGREVWTDENRPDIPTMSQQLTGMFVGERLARRARELTNLGRGRPEVKRPEREKK